MSTVCFHYHEDIHPPPAPCKVRPAAQTNSTQGTMLNSIYSRVGLQQDGSTARWVYSRMGLQQDGSTAGWVYSRMGLQQDGSTARWVYSRMGLQQDGSTAGWVYSRMGLQQDGSTAGLQQDESTAGWVYSAASLMQRTCLRVVSLLGEEQAAVFPQAPKLSSTHTPINPYIYIPILGYFCRPT